MAGEKFNRGAQLLRLWRDRKGKTQRDCAVILEIDTSHVNKWENGAMVPSLEYAVVIEQITRGSVPCGSWLDVPLPEHEVDPFLNPDADLHLLANKKSTKG